MAWLAPRNEHQLMTERTCPSCHQGDLITISLTVGESDVAFTTCHLCEAKWWFREGEAVPLQSVLGMVVGAKG